MTSSLINHSDAEMSIGVEPLEDKLNQPERTEEDPIIGAVLDEIMDIVVESNGNTQDIGITSEENQNNELMEEDAAEARNEEMQDTGEKYQHRQGEEVKEEKKGGDKCDHEQEKEKCDDYDDDEEEEEEEEQVKAISEDHYLGQNNDLDEGHGKENEEDHEPESEFIVESVIDKKIDSRGFAKYLVKWEGYPASQNSWEPLENLVACDKRIEEFEMRRATKLARMALQQAANGSKSESSTQIGGKSTRAKHKSFEVDSVVGSTELDGQRYFLVSLKNQKVKGFIRSCVANKMFPEKVIDFYIENLRWKQKPK